MEFGAKGVELHGSLGASKKGAVSVKRDSVRLWGIQMETAMRCHIVPTKVHLFFFFFFQLKQLEFTVSILEAESIVRGQHGLALARAIFLACRRLSSCCVLTRPLLGVSLQKEKIFFYGRTCST